MAESQTTRKAPKFEPSTDRRILANTLKKAFVDEGKEVISYAELTAAIGGRDVQGKARCLLNGARTDLARDYHILTHVVRNEGIRISLDPPGCLSERIEHIRRCANKGAKHAGYAIAKDGLDNEQKRGILACVGQFGAIRQFATDKARKQIEGKIDEKAPTELPLLPTIDAVRAQFETKP